MKKLFLIPLIMILVGALLFGSCAKPAPVPAPAPTPVPTPAPTPTSAKPIRLKFSHPLPLRTTFHTDGYAPWAELIKERTTAIGKPVEVVLYGGAALGNSDTQFDIVKTGIAEIAGGWGPMQHPGVFPLNDILQLPFLLSHGAKIAGLVAQELYDTQPAFKKEFDDARLKILWFQPPPDYNILVTRTRQVKTLEDLKGAKISVAGSFQAQALSTLGCIPVQLPPPEVYPALERGLLEGTFECPEAIITTFKFNEVTKYRTILPVGIFHANLIVAMNPDSFNMLPPEVQKIFNELTGAYMSKISGEAMEAANDRAYQDLLAYDKKVGTPEYYFLPEVEFRKWMEATKPVDERLVAELEAKGLPGKTIYQETLRLIEKYSK